MANLVFETKELYTADGWKHYKRDVLLNGEVIGDISYMTCLAEEEDLCYIEDFGINPEYQNKGYGTQVLKEMSSEFWTAYLAPTNENNQRLYERLGEEVRDDKYDGVDQGYGVYILD
ncbi:GNAT family N-acetyltransferase [Aerococcaceae bacterium WGS1372]